MDYPQEPQNMRLFAKFGCAATPEKYFMNAFRTSLGHSRRTTRRPHWRLHPRTLIAAATLLLAAALTVWRGSKFPLDK
jgi:hypothetical protein